MAGYGGIEGRCARCEQLEADNARLRARIDVLEKALEAAPAPGSNEALGAWLDKHDRWWLRQRQTALGE